LDITASAVALQALCARTRTGAGSSPIKSIDAPLVRYLSGDEIARFLNSRRGAFRNLAISSSSRFSPAANYGELCRLKVAACNSDVGTLRIRAAKSGQVRHVTLTAGAPELIERLIDCGVTTGEPGAGCSPDEAQCQPQPKGTTTRSSCKAVLEMLALA
jgi:hypothetical protein